MEEKIEYLEPIEYVKQVFAPSEDKNLLSILQKVKLKRGLADLDISILTPEEPNFEDPDILGRCAGSKEEGYSITILPKSIEESLFFDIYYIFHHEITHIKYGDCDRNLPKFLKFIFRLLVEKPRADFYAFIHRFSSPAAS